MESCGLQAAISPASKRARGERRERRRGQGMTEADLRLPPITQAAQAAAADPAGEGAAIPARSAYVSPSVAVDSRLRATRSASTGAGTVPSGRRVLLARRGIGLPPGAARRLVPEPRRVRRGVPDTSYLRKYTSCSGGREYRVTPSIWVLPQTQREAAAFMDTLFPAI